MKIDVIRDIQGRQIENIILNDEELKAMSQSQEILAARSREQGVTWNAQDIEHHEWKLLGVLRREGIAKMLDFARTVQIKTTKNAVRSYC